MTPLKATGPQTICGKSHILRGLGSPVSEGETVTRLGRNGAGKTTSLRSIIGRAEVAAQAAYPGNAA